jgi:LysM repeat protein
MSHRPDLPPHLPLVQIAALMAIIAGIALAVPAAATDRVVVVLPGDTLSEIALANGVSVAQLRELNGIADPNRIFAGQRLRLTGTATAAAPTPSATPGAATHIVAAGEHLTGIARRYGSSIAAIAKANALANPSFLRVGQRLTIPGAAASTTAPAPAPAPATPAAAPPAPVIHVVAPGENLTGIARRYGSTITAIARANALADPSFLRVGQRLTIPDAAAPAARMPGRMASLVAARGAIGAIIRSEATAQGVPVAFALAVAWQESGWQPGVVSRAGAVGVMQLTPPTADWVASTMLGHRVDLYDAQSNIRAGITLLRHYLDRYHGDRAMVLAAYFQGQAAADRHGVYQVTRGYIASISALEEFFAN